LKNLLLIEGRRRAGYGNARARKDQGYNTRNATVNCAPNASAELLCLNR
jgi:hypothetical protein